MGVLSGEFIVTSETQSWYRFHQLGVRSGGMRIVTDRTITVIGRRMLVWSREQNPVAVFLRAKALRDEKKTGKKENY